MTTDVAVVGAGTMGAGIAQVAAAAGHRVLVADAAPGAAERAIGSATAGVERLVAKGRLRVDPASLRLEAAGLADLAGCGVVVEAVAEDLEVKRRLLADLEDVVAPDCLLASNSSSLSPTAMASGLRRPERVVGLHFFNPVPAMRLVEVVSGLATAPEAADAAAALAESWGKTVIRSAGTPGFVVNRIARPYYAEAWRLIEERAAEPAVVDALMTGAGGFRMGPFTLMDLIGHDVNEAVTRSVWASFGHDPRFAPSLTQRSLVEAGWLGRKAGRGCYTYDGGSDPPRTTPQPRRPAPAGAVEHGHSELGALLSRSGVPAVPGDPGPGLVGLPSGVLMARCRGVTAGALAARHGAPVVVVDRTLDDGSASAIAVAASDGCDGPSLAEAIGLLQAAGLDVHVVLDTPGLVVTRTVAMLANLAADALGAGVAGASDIDTAMRLGTNYPLGPLEWADRWGAATVVDVLDGLDDWYRDGHYRASAPLRRAALSGRTFT